MLVKNYVLDFFGEKSILSNFLFWLMTLRCHIYFFSPQGARGFPGAPGLPGLKGHRVSSSLCNPFRYCSLLSRVWGALPSKSLKLHLSVIFSWLCLHYSSVVTKITMLFTFPLNLIWLCKQIYFELLLCTGYCTRKKGTVMNDNSPWPSASG